MCREHLPGEGSCLLQRPLRLARASPLGSPEHFSGQLLLSCNFPWRHLWVGWGDLMSADEAGALVVPNDPAQISCLCGGLIGSTPSHSLLP